MSPAITTAYGDDTEKVPESLRLVRHPSYRGQTYFGRRPVSSSSGWVCWELLPRKRKVSVLISLISGTLVIDRLIY